jgi:hypothetical protein
MSKSNKPTVARLMKKFSLKVLIVGACGSRCEIFYAQKARKRARNKDT